MDLAAPLAAAASTPALVPLWIKVALAVSALWLITVGLIVWAVVHLVKSQRNASNR